jgi:SOS-response transcriptional repressor LexA
MQNFDANMIIERVKFLRNQYAGPRGKSKFAHALGISASTYSYYENDRNPPIEVLLKICQVTGADLQWLIAGEKAEKKFPSGPNTALMQKIDELLEQNPDLAQTVSAFVELLDEKKAFDKPKTPKAVTRDATRPAWIPVLGRTAAGMLHFWDTEILPDSQTIVTKLEQLVKKHTESEIVDSTDGTVSIDLHVKPLLAGLKQHHANLIQVGSEHAQDIVEFVQCEEIFQLFPDSFALQVDGDSMSPRINDGDIVILSPSVPAAQGHAAVARLANQIGVTCKLIRTTDSDIHLIPINERYETKVVPRKDLLWALAVLWHVRT